jgi:hypothetical protein
VVNGGRNCTHRRALGQNRRAHQSSGNRGISTSRTEWAAVFLAAAELVRLGYVVSFTMGNRTPMADLMVGNPISGKVFWIDVKGRAGLTGGGWAARAKTPLPDLFYILVSVANDRASDEFFILSQADFNQQLAEWRAAHPTWSVRGEGISRSAAQAYKGRWHTLPGYRRLLQSN